VKRLLGLIRRRYLPDAVVTCGVAGTCKVALLGGKTPVNGQAAVYLCRDFTCRAPVTSIEALEEELERF